MYTFEELDGSTRSWMLIEFRDEESRVPYRGKKLAKAGADAFAELMVDAILRGNEHTLAVSLARHEYWQLTRPEIRRGRVVRVRINVEKAARALAITEFNTWYVRGLGRRLLEEGVASCQVYRAEDAWLPRDECISHELQVFPVQEIYDGHRARYWPEPGNALALSIPVGTNCHHTIRRVQPGH